MKCSRERLSLIGATIALLTVFVVSLFVAITDAGRASHMYFGLVFSSVGLVLLIGGGKS